MTEEALVALLWRDGAVPEWINLSVIGIDAGATLVEVMACGRFTANDALLYHAHEGRPPFHVLGPALPPDSMRDGPGRFSLFWSVHAKDPTALRRVLTDAATNVRLLVVRGDWCDDTLLDEAKALTRLVSLRLEGTRVRGPGLGALSPLSLLSWTSIGADPIDLTWLRAHASLELLHLAGEPAVLGGVEALAALKNLTSVDVCVPSLTDLSWVRAPRLTHVDLAGTRVSDRELRHLALLPRLRTLDLSRTPIGDEGVVAIAGVPTLWRLWLRGTAITDAALAALQSAQKLDRLDVRGTRVSREAIERLRRARPTLKVIAEG